MSPRGAVLALSIASAIFISIAALLAPIWIALSLLGLGLICSASLNHSYARCLHSSPRPKSRVPLDRLVALEILGAFAPPLAVATIRLATAIDQIQVDTPFAVVVGVSAGVIVICFLSSLVDWYYVLPRRDGLVGRPPCKAPHEGRWQRVTWFWFLHRFIAASATIGGVYAIAICLGIWLYVQYPEVAGGAGGVPVLVGIVTFFGRSYLRYIAQVWQRLFSPSAALGEHLETKVEGHPLSGYVFNVSIERVDLLRNNDVLTHASHGDIAKYCHHDSSSALCQDKCVRGNADATGKAPTGGHGGCLYETEPHNLEDAPGPRAFVL